MSTAVQMMTYFLRDAVQIFFQYCTSEQGRSCGCRTAAARFFPFGAFA